MSQPVDYKPSGFVAPCRNCGGQARRIRQGDTVTTGECCWEPQDADWLGWMCRFSQAAGSREVTLGDPTPPKAAA